MQFNIIERLLFGFLLVLAMITLILVLGMVVIFAGGGTATGILLMLSAFESPIVEGFIDSCFEQMALYLENRILMLKAIFSSGVLMLLALNIEYKKMTTHEEARKQADRARAEEEEFDCCVSLAVWKAPWLDSERPSNY